LKHDSTERRLLEKVVIGECDTYDVKRLKEFFYKGFREIDFNIRSHARVLLKPNLLSGKPPEKAVNTHPLFVKAFAEILLDHSCDVYIGDSPGYESTEKALNNSGIMDIVKSNGLKVSSFKNKIIKKIDGISPYKEFVLGEDPAHYDTIINLPKLKTHAMMGMTLGVKNTFGFIHALEKARWHLRAGKDRMIFASILIDIHNIVRPSITVLDGILGMDGDGPSNGRARSLGVVAMSNNAFILDYCVEKLVGIPSPLPVSIKAMDYDLIEDYEVVNFGMPAIDSFRIPGTMDTDWALPKCVKGILRNLFVKKPKLKKGMCKGCNICMNVCPAGAISSPEKVPLFDYTKCIRCYCCQEMCPEGAIRV
jgi:uncharacterized protein (DUF362 family)